MEPANENLLYSNDFFCLGGEEQFEPDYEYDDIGPNSELLTQPLSADVSHAALTVTDRQTIANAAAAAAPNNSRKFNLRRPGVAPDEMPRQRRRTWRSVSSNHLKNEANTIRCTSCEQVEYKEALDTGNSIGAVDIVQPEVDEGLTLEGEWDETEGTEFWCGAEELPAQPETGITSLDTVETCQQPSDTPYNPIDEQSEMAPMKIAWPVDAMNNDDTDGVDLSSFKLQFQVTNCPTENEVSSEARVMSDEPCSVVPPATLFEKNRPKRPADSVSMWSDVSTSVLASRSIIAGAKKIRLQAQRKDTLAAIAQPIEKKSLSPATLERLLQTYFNYGQWSNFSNVILSQKVSTVRWTAEIIRAVTQLFDGEESCSAQAKFDKFLWGMDTLPPSYPILDQNYTIKYVGVHVMWQLKCQKDWGGALDILRSLIARRIQIHNIRSCVLPNVASSVELAMTICTTTSCYDTILDMLKQLSFFLCANTHTGRSRRAVCLNTVLTVLLSQIPTKIPEQTMYCTIGLELLREIMRLKENDKEIESAIQSKLIDLSVFDVFSMLCAVNNDKDLLTKFCQLQRTESALLKFSPHNVSKIISCLGEDITSSASFQIAVHLMELSCASQWELYPNISPASPIKPPSTLSHGELKVYIWILLSRARHIWTSKSSYWFYVINPLSDSRQDGGKNKGGASVCDRVESVLKIDFKLFKSVTRENSCLRLESVAVKSLFSEASRVQNKQPQQVATNVGRTVVNSGSASCPTNSSLPTKVTASISSPATRTSINRSSLSHTALQSSTTYKLSIQNHDKRPLSGVQKKVTTGVGCSSGKSALCKSTGSNNAQNAVAPNSLCHRSQSEENTRPPGVVTNGNGKVRSLLGVDMGTTAGFKVSYGTRNLQQKKELELKHTTQSEKAHQDQWQMQNSFLGSTACEQPATSSSSLLCQSQNNERLNRVRDTKLRGRQSSHTSSSPSLPSSRDQSPVENVERQQTVGYDVNQHQLSGIEAGQPVKQPNQIDTPNQQNVSMGTKAAYSPKLLPTGIRTFTPQAVGTIRCQNRSLVASVPSFVPLSSAAPLPEQKTVLDNSTFKKPLGFPQKCSVEQHWQARLNQPYKPSSSFQGMPRSAVNRPLVCTAEIVNAAPQIPKPTNQHAYAWRGQTRSRLPNDMSGNLSLPPSPTAFQPPYNPCNGIDTTFSNPDLARESVLPVQNALVDASSLVNLPQERMPLISTRPVVDSQNFAQGVADVFLPLPPQMTGQEDYSNMSTSPASLTSLPQGVVTTPRPYFVAPPPVPGTRVMQNPRPPTAAAPARPRQPNVSSFNRSASQPQPASTKSSGDQFAEMNQPTVRPKFRKTLLPGGPPPPGHSFSSCSARPQRGVYSQPTPERHALMNQPRPDQTATSVSATSWRAPRAQYPRPASATYAARTEQNIKPPPILPPQAAGRPTVFSTIHMIVGQKVEQLQIIDQLKREYLCSYICDLFTGDSSSRDALTLDDRTLCELNRSADFHINRTRRMLSKSVSLMHNMIRDLAFGQVSKAVECGQLRVKDQLDAEHFSQFLADWFFDSMNHRSGGSVAVTDETLAELSAFLESQIARRCSAGVLTSRVPQSTWSVGYDEQW